MLSRCPRKYRKNELIWRAFTIAKLLKSNDRAYSDKSLLVIGADGEQLGVMKLAAACQAAQAARLDLVLVSENSNPPVCRIMDFGKLLYEQKKKLKEQKKNQQAQKVKEIKFRLHIDTHDYGSEEHTSELQSLY